MIDISPKALRFARLAAEQQSVFARHPQIDVIKEVEQALGLKKSSARLRQYVTISNDTAAFCREAVMSFLDDRTRFETAAWDGNDFSFMQSFARDLDRQLTELGAKAH